MACGSYFSCSPLACLHTFIPAVLMQAELILASKKLNGGYTTHSALEMLPPFHMDMGVGGIDSRPVATIIRLTNPGQLSFCSASNLGTAVWHLK